MIADLDIGPKPMVRGVPGADAVTYRTITVRPVGTTIGAEITGVDLSDDLDVETLEELRHALLEWKVVFFRDQDITGDDQRRFAGRWGAIEKHPFFKYIQPDQTEVDVVRLSKSETNGGTENDWHNDVTWHVKPSFGAVLRAVEVPEVGGDTLWADAAAAYDGLSAAVREQIDGLTAVHTWRTTFGLGMSDEQREEFAKDYPDVEHPVVRVHPETGRKTVFVNRFFTDHIVGLSSAESQALLDRLYREVARPEYQVRFRWEPGSVAFWDNRSAQHYAVSDYYPAKRVMDRISIEGDRPYGVAESAG